MIKVGQKLKEVRIRRGLALEDVERATKIKIAFLEALEKGEYAKLPSSAYAAGFVKNYSIFLGLPLRETLALFRREFDERKVYKVLPESFAKRDEFSTKRIPVRMIIVGILFFFTLFGYIIFQYKYAIINPVLTVSSPKEKEVITSSDVKVLGETDPNVTVYVNNIAVSLDENGHFKKTISVFPGKEVITIKAVSRFGKETIIKRQIEVKPES